jgi:hypothetical protein
VIQVWFWFKLHVGTAGRFLVAIVLLGLLAACGASESAPEATRTESTTSTVQPSTASTTGAQSPELSPIEVAEAWLAAYQLGDVERFHLLTHPDATAVCVKCGYERQEQPYFAQIGEATTDATDSRMLALANGSLDPACTADGSVATCETLRTSDFGFFTGDGKPTQQMEATVEFTVEAGLVTRRVLTIHSGMVFDRAAVADYRSWLKDHYPSVEGELFAFSTILLTTAEQFEQHQRYVDEYQAER